MPGAMMALLFLVVVGGTVGVMFASMQSLRERLRRLEERQERDRELVEAVLLEDTTRIRRLMGRE